MFTSTVFITVFILLLFPVVLLLWITEDDKHRAKRLKSRGWSNQKIADRVGVHRTTVGRWLRTA